MISLDRLINILVTVALIEMMVLIGLRVKLADIVNTSRNCPLLARAAVANYLLVPGLAVVLLLLFGVNAMVAAGFLVLAVCPGAPYGPPFAGIARADVPEAVISCRHRRRSSHHCSCRSCCRGPQVARCLKSIRPEL